MTDFTLHDIDSAPEQSKPLLDKSQKAFGMIPNLHAVMAEAPGLLDGYQKLHELVLGSSFDNDETTVVWQTINVEHACHYCVPAHTGIAKSMKVSDEITNALRDETPLPSDKLEALRTFTLAVVRKRGEVNGEDLDAFYGAGYSQRQVLEIILVLSQKVMSNYVNHIAETPVDEPFKPFAWQKAK
ncbi:MULTISPECIES: carboxymuconolactone decarboxylase family protein [Marinobacter]|uniref:Carboxymuconolactone decarboxylase family protein n=1 Tax=Marinobacter suaedae TaxID=3057675 RepID=A0ABT8VZQ4_9GAMM|nr:MULTISPECIES: carboxymuconolactone decarboxylase family protein [unclassified Marinobacter]MBZ2169649.1 carboxymuconolactone decarboxylase family protein [Marinobacter sp. F4216]MDO3721482.1 carboxymuconolactone decarboxylase family protein [Marinobacter sp. chi1]